MCHPEAAAYHHHYTALEEQRRKALATFRQSFPGLPTVFSNCLIYRCLPGGHVSHTTQANAHINALGLPLCVQRVSCGTQYAIRIQFVEELI